MEKVIELIRRQVDDLLKERDRILIAIDGSCASGKTTLAAALAREYECNLFHMDDFFLRPGQRTPERLSEIGGNVDYERFGAEVLRPLKEGKSFSYRPYDCGSGELKEPVVVTPKKINIIEGSYSHHPYFEEPYDLKIFLKVSPAVREKRISQRPPFLHRRFFEEWIPMEQRYFDAFAIEEKADLSVMPEDNL